MKTLAAILLIVEVYFLHFFVRLLSQPELLRKLWWKHMTGRVIRVNWPVGEVEVGPNSRSWNGCIGDLRQMVYSSDPNDHYRPWLEANVGRQGWDWEWFLNFRLDNTLDIKFRKGKEEFAIQALLMWDQ